MDIAQYFEKLKVTEDLFKDVKFYVTGRVSEEVSFPFTCNIEWRGNLNIMRELWWTKSTTA